MPAASPARALHGVLPGALAASPVVRLPCGAFRRAPVDASSPPYITAYIAGPFAGASVQYRAQCTEWCAARAQTGRRVHCKGKCTGLYLHVCRPYIRGFIAGFFAAGNVPRPGQNARQCARECTVRARRTPGAVWAGRSRRCGEPERAVRPPTAGASPPPHPPHRGSRQTRAQKSPTSAAGSAGSHPHGWCAPSRAQRQW